MCKYCEENGHIPSDIAPGTKVVVGDAQSEIPSDNFDVEQKLEAGKEYEVEYVRECKHHTYVALKGIEWVFNSVNLRCAKEEVPEWTPEREEWNICQQSKKSDKGSDKISSKHASSA